VNLDTIGQWVDQLIGKTLEQLNSPPFFAQLGLILLAVITALTFSMLLKKRSPLFNRPPESGSLLVLRKVLYPLADLLFPLFNILALTIAAEVSTLAVQQSWLVRIAASLAVIFLIYSVLSRFIRNPLVRSMIKWIAIPIVILEIFGWLDEVTSYLESLKVVIGNIELSAYGLVRVTIFGLLLFWLGRISSQAGQRVIRNQQHLDVGTREVFAKLLQVGIFFLVFLLLLQVMGINLTTLTVFDCNPSPRTLSQA